jgi:hypothetical protein
MWETNRKNIYQNLLIPDPNVHQILPRPLPTQPETSTPSSNTTSQWSSPPSSPQGFPIYKGFGEDLWDFENNTEYSKDSDYQQSSTSKQFIKLSRTTSKDLKKYIEPEIANLEQSDGKILRLGKVTFADRTSALIS